MARRLFLDCKSHTLRVRGQCCSRPTTRSSSARKSIEAQHLSLLLPIEGERPIEERPRRQSRRLRSIHDGGLNVRRKIVHPYVARQLRRTQAFLFCQLANGSFPIGEYERSELSTFLKHIDEPRLGLGCTWRTRVYGENVRAPPADCISLRNNEVNSIFVLRRTGVRPGKQSDAVPGKISAELVGGNIEPQLRFGDFCPGHEREEQSPETRPFH